MKNPSKKAVIIIIATMLVVAIALSAIAIFFGGGDFRKAKWGMSPDEVKSRETGEIVTDSPYRLTIKTDNIEGVSAETNMFYNFDGENGLWQVSMGYNISGFDDKLANRIITAFEKKYGEATDYKETQISYEYFWKDDRTEIRIAQQSTYLLVSFTDINYVLEK